MPKISENFKRRSEIDVMIGRQVRKLRTLRGYSQVSIAKEIGVTFQQFQKYECGINRLCVSRLLDICKFCKVSPSYFFDSLLNSEEDDSSADFMRDNSFKSSFLYEGEQKNKAHNKEVLSLVKAFQKIDHSSIRSKVLSLVKTISSASEEDSEGSDDTDQTIELVSSSDKIKEETGGGKE